jgi:integrase
MPLRNVNARAVEVFVEQREEEGASRSTIARELVILRGTLKLAIHHGVFTTPIERVMPLEYATKYVPRKRWLTPEQAEAMYSELPTDRRGWFAFVLATGARRSEVDAWEKRDAVELDADAWDVRIRGTKTDAADDTIPITSIQRAWFDRAMSLASKSGPAFGPWGNVLRGLEHARLRLLACDKHRAKWGRARKGCAKCAKRPPMPEKVSPNDLRRSLGWWLRDAGVSPHLIGRILRHVDSRMAERVYAKGSREGLRSLIEAQIAVPRFVRDKKKPRGQMRRSGRPKRKKTA